jgi:hypothetical protein
VDATVVVGDCELLFETWVVAAVAVTDTDTVAVSVSVWGRWFTDDEGDEGWRWESSFVLSSTGNRCGVTDALVTNVPTVVVVATVEDEATEAFDVTLYVRSRVAFRKSPSSPSTSPVSPCLQSSMTVPLLLPVPVPEVNLMPTAARTAGSHTSTPDRLQYNSNNILVS